MENKTPKYWKGFEELNGDAEFEKHRHNEFAEKIPGANVLKETDLELNSTRRDFLKFMGFGISAATLTACTKQPIRKAIPFVMKPVDQDVSIPNFYATTCNGCEANCSLLVKTREGRPIKVDGNPESPLNKGTACAVGQSTVLSLYDMGRLQHAWSKEAQGKIEWEELDQKVSAALEGAAANGRGIRIVSKTLNSPSMRAAIANFTSRYATARHITYDAVSSYAIRAAHGAAFGSEVVPSYRFNEAHMAVSFGADFLGTWISPVEFTNQYSAARHPENENPLYHVQFESRMSLTGSNADLRAVHSPSQLGNILLRLHNLVAQGTGRAATGNTPQVELAGNAVQHTATELLKRRGRSIVVSDSNDLNHQVLIASINQMLGNYGTTIDIANPSYQLMGNDREMAALVDEMNAGTVDVLITIGTNPAYSWPDAGRFGAGMAKVKTSVAISERLDETAKQATYVAPDHHFLESWGDAEPRAGFVSIYQPTITPIFQTRAAGESLLRWAGQANADWYAYVRNHWQQNLLRGGNFEENWVKAVEHGFVNNVATGTPAPVSPATGFATALLQAAGATGTPAEGQVELVVYESVNIRDGRDANNPWLQELADPVTKVTWDNYVTVSPAWAKENRLENEDLIEIAVNNKTFQLPVVVQPGQRRNTLAVALGYGRDADPTAGKVMNEVKGANAFSMATLQNGFIIYQGQAVSVSGKVGRYELALTQTHHHVEGRDLVRETTHQRLAQGDVGAPVDAHDQTHHISLYKEYKYPGHSWGMAIDLNTCTGCNACVISCQAENNIPTVGKDEVRRRREMHWMRIDRYYSIATNEGDYLNEYKKIDKKSDRDELDFENVTTIYQPMLCQHCKNAPCENVCPVNAISHSSEGLNQQVYNRCVGTRYCANNCPYKVRRFNWFNYVETDRFDFHMNNALGRMVLNPDVTVRMRGVMEKCSFCVQRIQVGKLEAKKDGRALRDGDVRTACQQTCPANAIVFGDMNDPNSEISKLIRDKRSFAILTELNTRPALHYMSKVRNTPTSV